MRFSLPAPRSRLSPPPIQRNQLPLSESELDAALQKAAEESLGEREGAVIVIDPQNGRLRAVVNPRLAFEQNFPSGLRDKAIHRIGRVARGAGRPRIPP